MKKENYEDEDDEDDSYDDDSYQEKRMVGSKRLKKTKSRNLLA